MVLGALGCMNNADLRRLVVHGAMGCSQKGFKLVSRWHQLLSGFVASDNLPRLSRQSRLSANDKGDNEMIPGTVHSLLAFALQLRKTPETSTRRPSMKAVRPVIISNEVLY